MWTSTKPSGHGIHARCASTIEVSLRKTFPGRGSTVIAVASHGSSGHNAACHQRFEHHVPNVELAGYGRILSADSGVGPTTLAATAPVEILQVMHVASGSSTVGSGRKGRSMEWFGIVPRV